MSDNEELSDIAIEVISGVKDKRLKKMAVDLLQQGNIHAFSILENNMSKGAEELICHMILKMKNTPHSVQMDICKIYSKYKSEYSYDILEHVYRNGDCSYCRSNIVLALYKNGCLSDNIIRECLYDSYDETRVFAEKLRKRRGIVF